MYKGVTGGNGGNLYFNSGRFGYSNHTPPKITNDPGYVISWLRRIHLFLGSEGLKHPIKHPIMRIEDRLFDRGWVRSAMATRKCGNIYFRKYFMVVRKFTNIFVLLLILMVGSRNTLFLVCFT